jgi:hypothetical protein
MWRANGLPRFRITYTSRKRILHTEEKQSEIIEAPDLEDARAKANIKLGSNYPIDWTVSVEEILE